MGRRAPIGAGALARRRHPTRRVAAALKAMHTQPERAWTVGEPGRVGNVARATPAERSNRLVGPPALRELARRRLAPARDRLADPALTLDSIAARVGDSSGFALSGVLPGVRALTGAG